jgi:quaternary ammonium compound-resistance protein SugE
VLDKKVAGIDARDAHQGDGKIGTSVVIGIDAYDERGYDMSWLYLFLAGIFEIGWPLGLKLAQQPATRLSGFALAIVSMVVSGALLWLAQRHIPMGTAYAVWTGIGAAGTFIVGIIYFGDPSSLGRYLGAALIVGGVATLKLAH